ncbi:MAG TPA: hypothetical protein VFR47_32505 [Anaerolineales bacterium]|nr:hypothetical protein [Anaerolineales bacterium]
MISASDFIHLPYTLDLTQGGIAYAVRSLAYTYNRMGGSPYDRLRRIVAGVAVELAFRRYLSEQDIPFDVLGATPFTDPDRYDVSLGGRRCDLKSFLITYRQQISEMKRNPQIVLEAPALVPSDQHAAEGHSANDLYLFAFLSGLVAASREDLNKVIAGRQPHYLIHAMPQSWTRPGSWNPLGALLLKSESEAPQTVEMGGQDAGREMRSVKVRVLPRTPVKVEEGFFSLAYLHIDTQPETRLAIHSSALQETHLISPMDWGNIWVYGIDILLAGYLTREEFSRNASAVLPGSRVFQYDRTRTKNLAVAVSDLKPLSELFERVKDWARDSD